VKATQSGTIQFIEPMYALAVQNMFKKTILKRTKREWLKRLGHGKSGC
jgi:hypothetical protein